MAAPQLKIVVEEIQSLRVYTCVSTRKLSYQLRMNVLLSTLMSQTKGVDEKKRRMQVPRKTEWLQGVCIDDSGQACIGSQCEELTTGKISELLRSSFDFRRMGLLDCDSKIGALCRRRHLRFKYTFELFVQRVAYIEESEI